MLDSGRQLMLYVGVAMGLLLAGVALHLAPGHVNASRLMLVGVVLLLVMSVLITVMRRDGRP